MYTIQEAMAILHANTTTVVIAVALTYGLGFLAYLSGLYMQVKNREFPMAFWCHCWYFGHDFTFAMLFKQWWNEVGFWLFKVMCIGCWLFVVIEIICLYLTVKYERNFNWGKYFKDKQVSEKQAWFLGIAGYAIGLIIFAALRKLLGDPMCLFLMSSTLFICGLTLKYNTKERKYINHGSKFLCIAALIAVFPAFLPPGIGLFTTMIPSLNQPAFYILGALAIVNAIDFIRLTWTLPTKEQYLAEGGEIPYREEWETV